MKVSKIIGLLVLSGSYAFLQITKVAASTFDDEYAMHFNLPSGTVELLEVDDAQVALLLSENIRYQALLKRIKSEHLARVNEIVSR